MQDRVDWVDVAKGICINHGGDDAPHARRGRGRRRARPAGWAMSWSSRGPSA